MKKNLKSLFTEDVQKIISDETLTAIENAIESKTELAVESALLEQDEQYAAKLKNLIKVINDDHVSKAKKLLESYDKDKASKLAKLVKKYEREQNTDLKLFKKQLIESVGNFIDEFIDTTIPKEDFSQAVKNKTAYNVLENLRSVLAVDSAVMQESIAGPIIQGKQEMEALRKENDTLKNNVKILKEQNENTARKLILENKTAKFPTDKRNFIKKALGDKSVKFIEENFDYTLRLFEKQEKKQLEVLKEDAIKGRKEKPDFIKSEKVITEKVNKEEDAYDPYVHAMDQMKF
jgi:hypothetical protein